MKLTFDGFGINDADDTFKTRVATINKSTTISPEVLGPLLAAAPDLLESLREALKSLEYAASVLEVPEKSTFQENIENARNAVAKATGELK